MATVRSIGEDACREIGVLGLLDSMGADLASIVLTRFQNQLNAWQADQLTLFNFTRTAYTLPANTLTRTIGPSGDITTAANPVFVNGINYVNPGSSPASEVAMGRMMPDQYQALTIKALPSALPLQWFFNAGATNGTLTFWPEVNQDVGIAIYTYFGVGVPAALSDTVVGPPGYAEAFMYQLAVRLCTPLFRTPPPVTVKMAAESFARLKRPNVNPPLLGVDVALVPNLGAGYNVLSDTTSSFGNR